MAQKIFIIGATGKVGRTLVNQIIDNGDMDKKHENPTVVVGVASSKEYLYDAKGLMEEDMKLFASREKSGTPYTELRQLADLDDEVVFVDTTAEKFDFHSYIINKTNHSIVTANKNPLCFCSFDEFKKLTSDFSRYGYRCSVMAGAEAVSFIQDLTDVNDSPLSIRGCFSGTIGFITSELDKGRDFSQIVREAYEKGYTEPHPKDDLNGLDVARKLLILARTAGLDVDLEDIELEPLVDSKYFDLETEEFLNKISEVDEIYAKKVSKAKDNGSVLRYVAEIDENKKLKVSLKEVKESSPLGSLSGTSNKIVVVTTVGYPEGSAYSIQSPGAGLEVTAQNVRRDLLYRLKQRKLIEQKVLI
ncbi:hypothetical protein BVX95_02420 [archaeon D22]|nr:hypothetical protein BVX95_02420 [archaeon D22]